jgi:hypothetical protein
VKAAGVFLCLYAEEGEGRLERGEAVRAESANQDLIQREAQPVKMAPQLVRLHAAGLDCGLQATEPVAAFTRSTLSLITETNASFVGAT